MSWCGFGRRIDISKVKSRPVWNNIAAFRNGEIFTIHDSYLNRPGPRLVEGAEKIAKILGKIREENLKNLGKSK